MYKQKEMDHWQPKGLLDHSFFSLSVSSTARGPSADVKIMNLSPFIVMFEELLKVSLWESEPDLSSHQSERTTRFLLCCYIYI